MLPLFGMSTVYISCSLVCVPHRCPLMGQALGRPVRVHHRSRITSHPVPHRFHTAVLERIPTLVGTMEAAMAVGVKKVQQHNIVRVL